VRRNKSGRVGGRGERQPEVAQPERRIRGKDRFLALARYAP
jgi:hypothetical protein